MDEGVKDRQALKNALREALRTFIYKRTKRNPVILPIFLDV
jgi:ribonuclease J